VCPKYRRQFEIPIRYRGHSIGSYRLDLLVEDLIVIELKSVERCDRVFEAQLLAYLRAAKKRLGLLINFTLLLKYGIKRVAL
jgi:GxxExxY protein